MTGIDFTVRRQMSEKGPDDRKMAMHTAVCETYQLANMTGSEIAIYFPMLWKSNEDLVSFLSPDEMAESGGVTRRQALRALRGLEEKQLIRRREWPDCDHAYDFLDPPPAEPRKRPRRR